PWLGGYGGWMLDGHKPTLDTPAMAGAVGFYQDLKFKYKYVPQECDYNCMDGKFKEEKVPFIINGDWAIQTYSDSMKENFGTAKLPKVSSTGLWPTPTISGKYFMLNADLKKKPAKLDLVKRFVDFYTNRDNQVRQLETLKRLPSLKAANDAPQIKENPALNGSMEQLLAGKPMPMVTELRAVWDAMRPYLGRIMTQKENLQDGIRKMQSDAESKIEGMNK
ncbi:MAG: extracellular solute-binding protein, partial [Elusimicrobiaceae bacterium]